MGYSEAKDAGVVVAEIEQEDVALCDGILPIFTGQHALPILHEPHYIVFVEVVRKGLRNSLQSVSYHAQPVIIGYRPHFFFHPQAPLSVPL